MGVPPTTLTLALGLGFGFVSPITVPGSFAVGGAGETPRDFGVAAPDDAVDAGGCRAPGCSDSPNLAAFDLELPAM